MSPKDDTYENEAASVASADSLCTDDESGASAYGTGESESSAELATRETRAVLSLRVIVVLVLVMAAVAVTLLVWFTTSNAEQEDFETNYQGAANKLLESFEEIVGQKLGAIAGLGVTFTSYAQSVNATWPFVTMNLFQQRAASARSLSDTLFLELLPIVTGEDRLAWEKYSVDNKGWLDEGRAFQKEIGLDLYGDSDPESRRDLQEDSEALVGDNVLGFVDGDGAGDSPIADKIWRFDENWASIPDPQEGPYFPIWQSSPIIVAPRDLANFNLLDYEPYAPYIVQAAKTGEVCFGGTSVVPAGNITSGGDLATSFFAFILSYAAGGLVDYQGDPFSSFYVPVFDSFDKDHKVVGVMVGVLQWAAYFKGVLPSNAPALTVVLGNSCEGNFTYKITSTSTEYVGLGDLHDTKFTDRRMTATFEDLLQNGQDGNTYAGFTLNEEVCSYQLHVYPTQEFSDEYKTNLPLIITLSVGAVFCLAIASFFVYDRLVERRQDLVLTSAKQTTAIVSNLFPAQIKNRLLEQSGGSSRGFKTLSDTSNVGGKPIADLFLETSVCFADVTGFTAWSSVREPSQVFTLLETLYQAFDKIATRRRVFKVETVGDCYVAVAGMPDPRKDHAVAIARFAADIIAKMYTLSKELEVILGPGELNLRIGIHSGPVTAGVLRGERARFQLFGDTMNTTSRIESSGMAGRIHCSAETAELIRQAGKDTWLEKRTDNIAAKGKGSLETWWVNVYSSTRRESSVYSASSGSVGELGNIGTLRATQALPGVDEKTARLIDWNVEMLLSLLKQVVAQRQTYAVERSRQMSQMPKPKGVPLEEICEIISLPEFHGAGATKNPDEVVVPRNVIVELRELVAAVCSLYQANPFHNFEHASHVLMAVTKTLSRIVAPSTMTARDLDQDQDKVLETMHDHTYGITGDPLVQFACAFSALIHDVDHSGVSNAQLVEEKDPLCARYNDRSVAEQNSLDLSWNLLMTDRFQELRRLLIPTEEEQKRFRQLVVNSVMATDIADKEQKLFRNNRWDKAFKKGDARDHIDANPRDEVNRKATIVIEHIIQASDISHTMQHWHIYRKWNTKLFCELYVAYLNGRMEKNPADFWYKGEIGFFDFYIIPLTQKLKECGVFGVSSGEFLNYAQSNRAEWVEKGEAVTAELIQMAREKYGDKEGGVSEQQQPAPEQQLVVQEMVDVDEMKPVKPMWC